ncbi:MAG: transglutaminase domain-containing protein, partial [Candidatus Sumerlaeota bacterium]|nr:transglutaminase domain-containing protein [Candidatus Sumerlaeota bacterium]
ATVSFNWNHQLSLWMDDPANTCSLARARDEVLSYQAISWVRPPDAGDPEAASAASGAAPLRSARQRLPSERAYLQLSPMERAPEIRALAETIVKDAGARTRYEQAAAVERYLRTRYSYDLQNLDYDRIHPTEAFLLDQRRGHCEHFASGMAVLLRLLNVPCRIVNGFYTNRWNKFMNFFLVEQSDAHTWVEVYFPTGWVAFDPTPPDSIVRAPAENPLLREVSAWIDALRMQWYLHVIDYDLNHQERLIQSLGSRSPHAISDLLRWGFHTAFWVDRGGVRYTAVRSARAIVLGLAAGAAVFLALTAGGFVARRKRARAAGDTALRWTRIRMYEQILRALARRGLPRPAAATALEFAGVVEARRPDLSGFLALTRRYYEARFAEAALTAEDEAAFRQCLRQARTKPRRA